MSSLDTKLSYSSQVGIYHELHPILFHMNGYLQGSKETGISHTISWTNEAIADRKSQIEKEGQRDGPLDLLSKFLKSHKENPENFTEYGIFMACLQNVAAGSDTTAISLCSILYHLLKNHLALRKLRREIMEMEEKGKVSESITFQESQNLPYLQAVIKEGLRIHPAIGLPLSRVVPRGGVTINGRFFPQGVSSSTIPSPNYNPLFQLTPPPSRQSSALTHGSPPTTEPSIPQILIISVRNVG